MCRAGRIVRLMLGLTLAAALAFGLAGCACCGTKSAGWTRTQLRGGQAPTQAETVEAAGVTWQRLPPAQTRRG